MNVIVSPPAREDAILTQDRLEREQSGYGLAFAEEFRRAIEQIGTMPRLFSPTEDGPDDIETRSADVTIPVPSSARSMGSTRW